MKLENLELYRIKTLLNTKIIESNSPFAESVFIEILIRLNDLLGLLDKNGQRITFVDDVDVQGEVKDITDLVSKLRNASCHVRSGNIQIGTNIFVFNRFFGYTPNGIKMGEIVLGSQYKDDTAFYYGLFRIYLNRHIKRLIEEISPLYNVKE